MKLSLPGLALAEQLYRRAQGPGPRPQGDARADARAREPLRHRLEQDLGAFEHLAGLQRCSSACAHPRLTTRYREERTDVQHEVDPLGDARQLRSPRAVRGHGDRCADAAHARPCPRRSTGCGRVGPSGRRLTPRDRGLRPLSGHGCGLPAALRDRGRCAASFARLTSLRGFCPRRGRARGRAACPARGRAAPGRALRGT